MIQSTDGYSHVYPLMNDIRPQLALFVLRAKNFAPAQAYPNVTVVDLFGLLSKKSVLREIHALGISGCDAIDRPGQR